MDPVPFLLLAVLVAGLTGAVAWRVVSAPAHDPDARFWYAFAGLSLITPVLVVGAVAAPLAGGALLLVVVLSALLALRWMPRRALRRRRARLRALRQGEHSVLAARHAHILTLWARYELDPAAAISYPAMSDVRSPATQSLVRAVARAEGCRDGPDYARAVAAVESAFAAAEEAAGAPLGATRRPQLRPGALLD